MDLNYLKRLLKIFDDSGSSELTIEEEGSKIHLSKKISFDANLQNYMAQIPQQSYQPASNQVNIPAQTIQLQTQELSQIKSDLNLHTITSPIVGTFYRAASPDAEPFVEVGSRISAGTTLCIVEAMKLMNEIESDISGTISEILVGNGEPVEYGQPLFHIKLD
jgi:acetyl-CoA carboxylase biotin carboxyl carrier protein